MKCGVRRVGLSRRTLILGKVASGKSAIVNAVELALSGRASDVAGRTTLAKDAELWQLADAADADEVFAQVTLSDGQVARWSLRKGHRSVRTGPEAGFPLRAVREAILGNPETARKWIIGHGEPFAWEAVLALVPASLHARLSSVAPPGGEPADRLVAALEEARRRARASTATAKAAREAAKAVPPTRPTSAVADVERALADAEAKAQAARERVAAAEAALAVTAPPTAGVEVARAALLVAESLIAQGESRCFCGAPLDLANLSGRVGRAKERLAQATALEEARGLRQAEVNAASYELLAQGERVRQLEGEKARLAAISNTVQADTQRRHEEQALAAEREAHEFGQLGGALATALGELVEKSRVAFEAKVQRCLPAAFRFGVDLTDGERAVLRVGLRRGGALHSAVSGSEWAQVTAALAMSTGGLGLTVVVPEDRAWDPDALTEALRAFAAVDACQILVTSTVAPRELPAGWTVVAL